MIKRQKVGKTIMSFCDVELNLLIQDVENKWNMFLQKLHIVIPLFVEWKLNTFSNWFLITVGNGFEIWPEVVQLEQEKFCTIEGTSLGVQLAKFHFSNSALLRQVRFNFPVWRIFFFLQFTVQPWWADCLMPQDACLYWCFLKPPGLRGLCLFSSLTSHP